jgi:membrane-bound lytic murein transglycosylase B
MPRLGLGIAFLAIACSSPALAARCGGDFYTFVQNISAEAAAAGISQSVISSALSGCSRI